MTGEKAPNVGTVAEFEALSKVIACLEGFDEGQQTRILGAAAVFFDLGGELTGRK